MNGVDFSSAFPTLLFCFFSLILWRLFEITLLSMANLKQKYRCKHSQIGWAGEDSKAGGVQNEAKQKKVI